MPFGPPRQDYFVRISPNDTLAGPLDYRIALAQARFLSSRDDNPDGTAEIVTFVGSRAGDHSKSPPTETVQHLFVRGRLLFSGEVARYNSPRFVGLGIGGIR